MKNYALPFLASGIPDILEQKHKIAKTLSDKIKIKNEEKLEMWKLHKNPQFKEWFEDLKETGDDEFVIQNAEYKLCHFVGKKELWLLYIGFLVEKNYLKVRFMNKFAKLKFWLYIGRF